MAKLQEYQNKRDFNKTKEPKGGAKRGYDSPVFVIQKHNASQLHYDLRLEINGTLKSWAVPRGPSTDPSEKRLATETEDHPLEYADFEGTIPKEEYGGGSVIVWDTGSFKNITEKDGKTKPLDKAYDDGEILVELHGKKLQGGYALVKMQGRGSNNWLLIKKKDEHSDKRCNHVSSQPESVLSDKTNKEIEQEMDNG